MIIKQKHSAAEMNIFTLMSGLARSEQAHNLSQGLPDYPIAPALAQLLSQAAQEGWNQYAPMPGLQILREQICIHFAALFQSQEIRPEMVTITPGATYAIYTSLTTFIEKGDEVIYLEPAFDCYLPAIEINGGIPVAVPLDPVNHFEIDWQGIQEAITARTRAIIINTPHNPTGRVWTLADWRQLAQIIGDKNIFIISDEVYHEIIFDGITHHPGFLQPALKDKIISIYSFGKTFHITGWKVGFCVASPAITKAFQQLHQYMCFSVNTPAQYALAMYLATPKQEPAALVLQAKRDLLVGGLQNTRLVNPHLAQGTYFQLYDYSQISDLPDVAFAEWLAKTHKVATIPLSAFYKKPSGIRQIRLSFAKKDEVLVAASHILSKL